MFILKQIIVGIEFRFLPDCLITSGGISLDESGLFVD